jgi:S-adenosylmethionine/arginine decarboxylase-like enzyme
MTNKRDRGHGDTQEFYAAQRRLWPHWSGDDGYAERATDAPYGYQMCLDLYQCNAAVLCDIGKVYEFLDHVVDLLGVLKQAPPYVFLSPPGFKDKAGISAWVPLVESHICLDTLTTYGMVSLDVYCCRKFDDLAVRALAECYFEPRDFDSDYIERGRRYRVR